MIKTGQFANISNGLLILLKYKSSGKVKELYQGATIKNIKANFDYIIPLSRFGWAQLDWPFVSAAKFYDKFNWMFTSIMKLFKGKN